MSTMTQNTQAVEAAERDKFEAACVKLGQCVSRKFDDPERYAENWIDWAWSGWKMRAELARPLEVAPVEPLCYLRPKTSFDAATAWEVVHYDVANAFPVYRAASRVPVAAGEGGDEILRLRQALVFVAHALHGTRQYMLPRGIALVDGDGVTVALNGWYVSVKEPGPYVAGKVLGRMMYECLERQRATPTPVPGGAGGDVGADKISPRHCGHPNHPGCDDCTPQDAAPAVDGMAISEGCTPADAQMLRVANHQLAEENSTLRNLLRPFAVVARPELSRATVAYMIKQDPERQHFETPTMHRAFNRAAEALRADYTAPPSVVQPTPVKVDEDARAKDVRKPFAPAMNINGPLGRKVIYTGKNGYPGEHVSGAKAGLIVGCEYVIERCDIHSSSTSVFLAGIKGGWNSVIFAEVADWHEYTAAIAASEPATAGRVGS